MFASTARQRPSGARPCRAARRNFAQTALSFSQTVQPQRVVPQVAMALAEDPSATGWVPWPELVAWPAYLWMARQLVTRQSILGDKSKTQDGDEAKWNAIQAECSTLLSTIISSEEEISDKKQTRDRALQQSRFFSRVVTNPVHLRKLYY